MITRATELLLESQKRIAKLDITPVVDMNVLTVEAESDDYTTEAGSTAVALNKQKLKTRIKLSNLAPKNYTSLELFAGKGNLTRAVYQKSAKRCICVEYNKTTFLELIQNTDQNKVKCYNMNNLLFVENELSNYPNIDIVDFDAFGSITPIITKFFENYKVKKPLLIGITDGYLVRAKRMLQDKAKLADMMIKGGYPSVARGGLSGSKFIEKTVDLFMQKMATKHKFKIKRIVADNNRMSTIYMGYRITP